MEVKHFSTSQEDWEANGNIDGVDLLKYKKDTYNETLPEGVTKEIVEKVQNHYRTLKEDGARACIQVAMDYLKEHPDKKEVVTRFSTGPDEKDTLDVYVNVNELGNKDLQDSSITIADNIYTDHIGLREVKSEGIECLIEMFTNMEDDGVEIINEDGEVIKKVA